jgi:hypothetical protein
VGELGLVLLSYVIGAGFTFVWDRFANTTWGTAPGTLRTACIGAGSGERQAGRSQA